MIYQDLILLKPSLHLAMQQHRRTEENAGMEGSIGPWDSSQGGSRDFWCACLFACFFWLCFCLLAFSYFLVPWDAPASFCTLPAPDSTNSPWGAGSFYGRMTFRNRDLGTRCAPCCCNVSAFRLSWWAELGNLSMFIYNMSVHTHLYFCICWYVCILKTYESTLVSLFPAQHHQVQSSFLLSSFVGFFQWLRKLALVPVTYFPLRSTEYTRKIVCRGPGSWRYDSGVILVELRTPGKIVFLPHSHCETFYSR